MIAEAALTGEDVKILIVDDEPRNLDALEVMLEPLGCTLVRAHSADEALLAILRDEFGALILDIQMPGMSGIELATLVKQRNRSKDVPILFLTAHVSHDEDILRGYGVGGVDYLSKPIKADVLRSKVAVFADLHRKTRALWALNEELQHQVAERERAEVTLQQVNQELESRVAERTAALAFANRSIKENEQRLRMAIDLAGIAPWEWDVRAPDAACTAGEARPGWSWDMRSHPLQWMPELMHLWALEPSHHTTYEDFHQRVHPEDVAVIERQWQAALRDGQPFEQEFRLVLPTGDVRWIYSKGGAVRDEADRPLRMVGNNIDVTERKRADEALREADRHKSEFLAMLAHELRNPLAPVRTAAEVLRRFHADAGTPQLHAVDVIRRQVVLMTRLIDDLLDVSRIAQGKIALRRTTVDVTSVITQTAEACQSLFDEGGPCLSVHVPPGPLLADADPTRVAQVIENLLSNAAKFTPAGGHVRLAVESNPGEAVITVTDDGIGLDHDQIVRVFDRFVQVDTTLERARGGLGLGLTLVKTLVELHGGTVAVHSPGLGRGAEFVVRLRLNAVDALPEAPPAPPEPADAGTRRRVLVVDDNRDSAFTLGQLLELGGHDVRLAYDGLEAVEVAASFLPDVVLLDIGLPKLNGYEAAQRMRALPSGPGILIAALTGWGQDSDRERTAESGFDLHLVKPADPEALMALISGGPLAAQRK